MIRLTSELEVAPITQALVSSFENVEFFLFMAAATLVLVAFSSILAALSRSWPSGYRADAKPVTNNDAFLPVPRGIFDRQGEVPVRLNG